MANLTIDVSKTLGAEADGLLSHTAKVSKSTLHLPGPDFVDRCFAPTDRSPQVLASLQRIYGHGRLGGTGYMSILPVDQGIEHSAGASFAKNPAYFDGENIVKLAVEGGCNAVASTFGVLASVSRKYAHRIPFMVKYNHNELLTYPNAASQIPFGTVREAWTLGACAIGATIYFGSTGATREIMYVAEAFEEAHSLGMCTFLWCYLRNDAFKTGGKDYHLSTDLTGQANHLGVTIEADIIKQKAPETAASGFDTLKFGKSDPRMYSKLMTEHPIDMTRYQVAHCYMGRIPLINSGGASGANDLHDAVYTAVVNKRAGGAGLISGRKAFQRPMKEGVGLLNAIQDVYLCDEISLA